MRVIFMGSADFALPSLVALLDAGHDVLAIYSQPPRKAGRGQQPRPTPVHKLAAARGLPVLTPTSLKCQEAQAGFAAHDADLAVVAAYGLLLPQAILDLPRLGCVNVHGSLLPRWRGAAPIQRAILAGDSESGVCLMRMAAGLDTGPVYARAAVPITGATTAQSLHDDLAALGGRMLPGLLRALETGTARAEPQPEDGVTYAAKIDKAEGRIDWACDAAEIDRQVRALNPWPGCYTTLDGARLGVLALEPLAEHGAASDGVGAGAATVAPGTVLDEALTVACGHGAVRLARVQRAGKKPVDAAAFLRGQRVAPGTVLGRDAA